MKKVIDVLSDPDCEVIRLICVNYNLIEVNEGQCWSVKDTCFLSNPIQEEKIGLVNPRAFAKYDPRKQPDAKYFREILQNSLKWKLVSFAETSATSKRQQEVPQRQSALPHWRCQQRQNKSVPANPKLSSSQQHRHCYQAKNI